MLIINKIFAINKVDGIKDSDKLIGKYRKLLKTETLSESLKLFKS